MAFLRTYLGIYSLTFLLVIHCDGRILNFFTAVQYDSVLLESCYNKSGDTIIWTFQDDAVFINTQLVRGESRTGLQILPNGSLYIQHVSLHNEGTYGCIFDSHIQSKYYIAVEDVCSRPSSSKSTSSSSKE